ncbi:rod shape-determining protein RodA [Acaryochloris sp. 'Moss Beach']|uniref:rod shape-determining protein RodA n=1 Tax=Acaryochloris TaxID=155977 RepID=UPI001BAFDAFE|nr:MULTISPECIES: rod shape-determining protein RodA [Acaryochloris]QUY41357.1 rod shape-determining protein RodA [Acaryochloris marina S15]UJB70528.1 rod shape-determining protein RodA [Acaryochloris sp. 'Moss Beach']
MLINKTLRKWFPWRTWIQPWDNIDRWLLLLAIGLTVFGGILIRSTQATQGWTDWLQHWTIGAIGVAIAMTIATWPYQILLSLHWLIYAVTNLSLVAVIAIGTSELGAQRWISVAGFNVQPSEFAKIGVIISLAALLHHRPATKLSSVLQILAITFIPWALVLVQPDLGTSLVFAAITLGMMYWANANLGWIVLLFSPLISGILFNIPPTSHWLWIIWAIWLVSIAFIGWLSIPFRMIGGMGALLINLGSGVLGRVAWGFLQEYQKARIILFLDPEQDPLGGGYHLIQSRIAIGSGQLWGRGLDQGTQTGLSFIPEQHTDFIFSAVGEQFGFVGSLALIAAIWLLCIRLIFVALNAEDDFGSLIAIGVLSMVIFQVFVNISMTIGLAPVTGIPLPWLSYGRSALLTNFIAIGLVESVANHRKKRRF